jgi:hypothetical protein
VVSDRPDSLEERAKTVLRDSAEQLDGATRSRLTRARHAALEATQRKPAARWWLPATAGAAATVLAVVITTQSPDVETPPEALAETVDEFDILTAEDSLEFYRDVEFYAWLDEELGEPDADQDEHEA